MKSNVRIGTGVLAAAGVVLMTGHLTNAQREAPAYKDPKLPIAKRVDDLIGRMTLDEKIGQMTQADSDSLKPDSDVDTLFLGSVLSGGNSELPDVSAAGWSAYTERLQKRALSTRLGIPIIYGIDAVHGHNNVRGAVLFPHNIGLGATRNPALVEEAARITAIEVAATGMHWTFAPCIAVPQDERWGSAPMRASARRRSWPRRSAPPRCAGSRARTCRRREHPGDREALHGRRRHLQRRRSRRHEGGRSDASQHSHARLRGGDQGRRGSVMVSYNSWNGQKMHGNKRLDHRRAQGRAGVQGHHRVRLERDRRAARRCAPAHRAAA